MITQLLFRLRAEWMSKSASGGMVFSNPLKPPKTEENESNITVFEALLVELDGIAPLGG